VTMLPLWTRPESPTSLGPARPIQPSRQANGR
jgi:hypothetical protein